MAVDKPPVTKLGIKFESTIFCSLTCLDERKMFCLYLFFI